MRFVISGILIFLLVGPIGYGQQFTSRVDSTRFLIGDQTRIIIEGVVPMDVQSIEISKSSIEADPALEFVGQSPMYKEKINHGTRYQRELIVAMFDTGQHYIPAIPIVLRHAGRLDTLRTAPIPILVRPMALDSVLAPNKPIILEPIKLSDFLTPILGILALIAGIIAILYFSIWRKKKIIVEERVLTPYEIALNALDALELKNYPQQNKLKEYFAQLSIILRTYIEKRFHIPAAESTTYEISQDLSRVGFSEELKSEVIHLLQKIDLIKYAKASPSAEEVSTSGHAVRSIISKINALTIVDTASEEE